MMFVIFSDSYEEAKVCERRLENESTDINGEENLGRGQRKVKRRIDDNFVTSLSPPPKLFCSSENMECMYSHIPK